MIKQIKLSSVPESLISLLLDKLGLATGVAEIIHQIKEVVLASNPDATIGDLLDDDVIKSLISEFSTKKIQQGAVVPNRKSHDIEDYLDASIKCPVCDYVGELKRFAPKLEIIAKE